MPTSRPNTPTPEPSPPRQDPSLEGERLLHELETLRPTDLLDWLLGLALAGAVGLLGRCGGAQLPEVAALIGQFHRYACGTVRGTACGACAWDGCVHGCMHGCVTAGQAKAGEAWWLPTARPPGALWALWVNLTYI